MLGERCIQRPFITSRASHAGPSPPCHRGIHHHDAGRRVAATVTGRSQANGPISWAPRKSELPHIVDVDKVESVTIVFCRSEPHHAPGAVHAVLTGRATAETISGTSRPWRRR
jgi:hypothetical protein